MSLVGKHETPIVKGLFVFCLCVCGFFVLLFLGGFGVGVFGGVAT